MMELEVDINKMKMSHNKKIREFKSFVNNIDFKIENIKSWDEPSVIKERDQIREIVFKYINKIDFKFLMDSGTLFLLYDKLVEASNNGTLEDEDFKLMMKELNIARLEAYINKRDHNSFNLLYDDIKDERINQRILLCLSEDPQWGQKEFKGIEHD